MPAPLVAKPVNTRAALIVLFLGNIFIGSGVLAPAAMINTMTVDLGVSSVAIGALIGWGAVVLCIGAPAFGFFTNQVDRRTLLAASLLLYAVGHFASAFAPDYTSLFIIRLAMISGAAIFTPQAASAVALMSTPVTCHSRCASQATVPPAPQAMSKALGPGARAAHAPASASTKAAWRASHRLGLAWIGASPLT